MSKNWKELKALVTEGGYGTGFWKWSLDVDLEDLQDGKGEAAISVEQNHDTAGMSFAQYHGIVKSYNLPDGVKVSALQEVIDDIVNRADELTKGFSVEWNGSNRVARWESSEGDQFHNPDDAERFWDDLGDSLCDLECAQGYDLSSTDNFNFVYEAVKEQPEFTTEGTQSELQDKMEAILYDLYTDDDDWTYIEYGEAARMLAECIIEERETVSWRELLVTSADGDYMGELAGNLDSAPANLDNAVLDSDGAISEWPGFFIAAEGEEADADSPRGGVDWSGFAEALKEVRGAVSE